ncbi:MAG: glycoside hydrolase family 3 C-terminal domain-containing protein [bacterium]|nr:glycoside hydrolase family 3 C-terminal domain-containing protein [bacterium]MCM1424507.1 glycoside hydrolase family 3 C-terminal domain-containing protein [bacterium]
MTDREKARAQAREKAKELVNKMTMEERASQLRYDAPAIERLGVPAYNWWGEALHGVARAGTATSFPQAVGMAATFDPELLRMAGDVAATEGRAKYNAYSAEEDRDIYKGLTFWSPNVNIFRDPRWGRGQETYGEDPYLTSRLGVAYVEGLQGDGEVLKSAACAKHFAVHSGPEAVRHEFNAVASKKDMAETYLPAFKACVQEAGVEAVMGAYNRTNGEPCCGSKTLMQDILRGAWGFQGHYVSDCWAIRDFHEHHMVTSTLEESAAMALQAGCDLNCGLTYQYLLRALEQGLVTEEEITEAAVRLFTTRYLLGLFDGSGYDQIPYEKVECEEHLAVAERLTKESVVLLKNDGVLPLKAGKTIGVIGPNANSREALIGNYHGTSSRYITVLEGIQDKVGHNGRVLFSEGSHLFHDRVENLAWENDRIAEAVTVAKHSDVVVLCVGLNETLEGEEGDTGNSYASGDKADLLLPEPQRKLMDAVLAVGKPVVVCLMAGSAIDLSVAEEKAAAVLQLWYPGARGGKAVADILFGECSPSGKLSVTFYRSMEGMPDFEDYSMKGRTYRYLEREPLYPFGYGLTYGDVRVESAAVTARDAASGDVTLRAAVKNAGSTATQDVIQVYVKDEVSPLAAPNHSLCAFARVSLQAGETKEVELKVSGSAFLVANEEGVFVSGSGKYRLYVGVGQPDARTEKLTGKKSVEIAVAVP